MPVGEWARLAVPAGEGVRGGVTLGGARAARRESRPAASAAARSSAVYIIGGALERVGRRDGGSPGGNRPWEPCKRKLKHAAAWWGHHLASFSLINPFILLKEFFICPDDRGEIQVG